MAEALLISRKDVVKFTAMNGNVDTDKFIQYVKIAQDIHIQNYLGTELFDRIANDIVAGTLTGNYLALVNDYFKDMCIHWAMVEYLPFSAYSVSNKGVFKHLSENSQSVEKNEVDFLIGKETSIAEHYTERFVQYICNNSNLFPEYLNNTGSDLDPNRDNNNFSSIVI